MRKHHAAANEAPVGHKTGFDRNLVLWQKPEAAAFSAVSAGPVIAPMSLWGHRSRDRWMVFMQASSMDLLNPDATAARRAMS
ncbi:MAG: hypothetical protein K8F35_02250 [Dokdonella sp.]|uniref:hypothetical protein n=1 Tax=Dokdonella sp. TaxID=2291710 RepID=UPI0025BD3FF5|nr:hypothetical protein [Dokdonella sp.]MBZ0221828.1 hypothetical protein [Dokdonella sp.]